MWLSHKCQPVSPQVPWTQKGICRRGKEQHLPPKTSLPSSSRGQGCADGSHLAGLGSHLEITGSSPTTKTSLQTTKTSALP